MRLEIIDCAFDWGETAIIGRGVVWSTRPLKPTQQHSGETGVSRYEDAFQPRS